MLEVPQLSVQSWISDSACLQTTWYCQSVYEQGLSTRQVFGGRGQGKQREQRHRKEEICKALSSQWALIMVLNQELHRGETYRVGKG